METVTIDLYKNGIILETDVDGYVVGSVAIPSGYVPLSQKALLGTHYIIPGDQLRNGMIVLLEDGRVDPDIISPENPQRTFGLRASSSSLNRSRVEITSRWALVTQVEIETEEDTDVRHVSFVAIYADGTMKYREELVGIRWIMQMKTDLTPICVDCGATPEQHVSGPDASFSDAEAALVDLLGEDVVSTIKNTLKERLFGKTEISDDESQLTFGSDAADIDPRD